VVTANGDPDERWRLSQTAFITPTETLRAVCPELRLSDICPYRGLAAFTEADAEFFFGREALVAELVQKLQSNPRFLTVVGPSGSGKSSVVGAGLLPELRQGKGLHTTSWELLTFRPGDAPFAALANAGLALDDDKNLPVAVRTYLENHPGVERLILFADQFEELFALSSEDMQTQFMEGLLALLDSDTSVKLSTSLPITIILTLRADFYGHLLRYADIKKHLDVGRVDVYPMSETELKTVIEEPARQIGLDFEPGLVENIIEDASEVEHPLPLLESALTQLWRRRKEGFLTHTDYQDIGSVTGAIAQWAGDTYSGLDVEQRQLARRIFTRLVHFGERDAADTRQRRSLEELTASPERQETVHKLVQHLADVRLLVTDRDPDSGAETVEIIHDALIQEWGQLRHWLSEQREFFLWRQRLDERLQEWQISQDSGSLLRGATLAETQDWLEKRSDDLNPSEQAYIQKSIQAQKRMRGFQLVAGVIVLILAILVAFLRTVQLDESIAAQTVIAGEVETRTSAQSTSEAAQITAEARREESDIARSAAEAAEVTAEARQQIAEEKSLISEARRLAAEAQRGLDTIGADFVESMLVAVESLRLYRTLEGDQTIRYGLSLMPRPVSHFMQQEMVDSIAFSSDGKYLVVCCDKSEEDLYVRNTVSILDVVTGLEVARLIHQGKVNRAVFSSHGDQLITVSDDDDQNTARIHVWELASGQELFSETHDQNNWEVAISSNGNFFATSGQTNTVRIWDTVAGRKISHINTEDELRQVSFSPDGRQLLTRVKSNLVELWDVPAGQKTAQMMPDELVRHQLFSPTGKYLATQGKSVIQIWATSTGQEIMQLQNIEGVNEIMFSPDEKRLVTVVNNARVDIWDIITGSKTNTITMYYDQPWLHLGIVFSPDGSLLAIEKGTTIQIWDTTTGELISQLVHKNSIVSFNFTSDGQSIVTTSYDGAQVWEVTTGLEMVRIATNGNGTTIFALSPDNNYVAVIGYFTFDGSYSDRNVAYDGNWGQVWIWEMSAGQEVAKLPIENYGKSFGFNSDGEILAVQDGDKVSIWDTILWEEIAQLDGTSKKIYLQDNHWFGVEDDDKVIRVFDLDKGLELTEINHNLGSDLFATTISPSGEWIAAWTYGNGNYTGIWDMYTGKLLWFSKEIGSYPYFSQDGKWMALKIEEEIINIYETGEWNLVHQVVHGNNIWDVAFSPDENWFATTADEDLTTCIWELSTGRLIAKLTDQTMVNELAISPDSRWLASVSGLNQSSELRIWDAKTQRVVAEIKFDIGSWAVSFSADGQWLATGRDDGLVQVWEVGTWREIARMAHEEGVSREAIAFSPDNEFLVTMSESDKTVRAWLIQTDDLISEICNRLPRNLTMQEWETFFGDKPYRKTCPNLRLHPTYLEAARRTAREGNIQAAEAQFQQALELEPDLDLDPETEARKSAAQGLLSKGMDFNLRGNIEAAIISFRQTVELYPETEEAQIAAQRLLEYLRAGDAEDVITLYQVILDIDISSDIYQDIQTQAHDAVVPGLLIRSTELAKEGNFESAVIQLQKASEIDPSINLEQEIAQSRKTAAGSLLEKGRKLGEEGDFSKAMEQFQKAREISPNLYLFSTIENALNLALTKLIEDTENLAKEDYIKDAVIQFQETLDVYPELKLSPYTSVQGIAVQVLIAEGRELAIEGDTENSVLAFQRAVELDPQLELDPEETVERLVMTQELVKKGQELAEAGDIDSAIAEFEKAIKLDPDIDLYPQDTTIDLEPEVAARWYAYFDLIDRGENLAKQGEIKEAIVLYEEAQLLLDPMSHKISASALNTLCRFGSLWGYAADMIEFCERAVESQPENGEFHDSRGLARALTGNVIGAIEDFEFYVAWAKENDKYGRSQEYWIAELEAGFNPFDEATLKALRNE